MDITGEGFGISFMVVFLRRFNASSLTEQERIRLTMSGTANKAESLILQTLIDSELRYRRLFEAAQDGIILLDAKTGMIKDVNPYLIKMLGYSRDELIVKKLWEVGAFKDINASKYSFTALQENEYIRYENLPLKTKDGRLIQVEFVSNVYLVGAEKVIQCNIRNITEQKRDKEALRQSQEEAARANRLLLALSQAAGAVQHARTTEEVYSAIQDQAKHMGYSASGFEVSEDGQSLRIVYLSYGADLVRKAEKIIGLTPRNFHFRPRVDSVYQKVIRKGDTVFVKNAVQAVADTIPKKLRALAVPLVEMFKLGPSIFTPLIVGDRTFGLMAFTGPGLTEADSPAVAAFAGQAAIAIQNAQLFEQARQEIAERRRTEDALRKSEKRFQGLVDNSMEEISLVDPDGTLTWESPNSKRPLGYPPDAFMGKNVLDLFHPDERAGAARMLEQIQKQPGEALEATFRLRHQDGSWRWMDGVLTNLLDEPAVRSIVINYRDVTNRKLAEQEIASLAKFPSENPNMVLRLSRDGIVMYANAASGVLMSMWGCREGDPAPQVWRDLAVQSLGSKKNQTVDIECDGKVYEISVTPIAGPDYVNLYGRDVTERNRAVESMRLSEEKYRTLVDEVNDGIYVTDEAGVFTFANAALARIYGVENPHALVDRKFSDFLALEPPAGLDKAYRGAMQTGNTPEVINGQIVRPDGTRAFIEIKPTMIYEGGRVAGTRGVMRDVTQRKQAEEQIKNSNEELSMLFELSHSLAGADSLDEILDLVNRHAVESIHATFARIALLEGDNYILRAAYPIRNLGHDLGIGDRNPVASLPHAQRVLEQKEPIILLADDSGISADEKKALQLDFAQSLCIIPLRINDSSPDCLKILGMLMVGETRNVGREPFTPNKLRLAQSIGDSAAIAIRRMLLREQTERRLRQIIALSEIDQTILSSSDMDVSLEVLLAQAMEQLKVDAADIWLYNPASQLLEFTSGRGFRTPAFEKMEPMHLGEGDTGCAALERRTIHVPNLTDHFVHPQLLKALAEEPFMSYFAVPLIVKEQVKGVLELFHRSFIEPNEEWLKFLQSLANQAAIAIDNSSLFADLQHSNAELIQAYDATIQGWSQALDLRDNETEGHTLRVTELTMMLGRQFGLSDEDLVHVRRGALLHDIGKMGVPDRILLKPGPLTDEEWIVMRKHPAFANDLLSPIHFLRLALDIPYCHHEKWDGSGYPRGLSGNQIPLAARIFAVVDVFDALTSDRPYRRAWPREKVLEHIRSQSGTHFDPQVIKIYLESGLLKDRTEKKFSMEPVTWSEKFSVGVRELDQQHQQLIKMLNRLISTQGTAGVHSETIAGICMEMKRYAQTHFKTEERLMEAYGFPGLEDQKSEHRAFQKKNAEFSADAELGTDQVSRALLKYLADWLVHHILENDMAYRPFFKDKGVQ